MGVLQGWAWLGAASGIAIAHGRGNQWGLPPAVETVGTVLTWLLPPVLVKRSLASARYAGGFSGWFYSPVRKPLATHLVTWLGGKKSLAPTRPIPANAPTEILLGHAADEIFARLSDDARRSLHALSAAAAALAREATALRTRALDIAGERRRLRAATHPAPHEELAAMMARNDERAAVQGRLGATIAALEAIRLDLLRLDSGTPLPGTLTEQMDVVRDLQRWVDAAGDVNQLLTNRP